MLLSSRSRRRDLPERIVEPSIKPIPSDDTELALWLIENLNLIPPLVRRNRWRGLPRYAGGGGLVYASGDRRNWKGWEYPPDVRPHVERLTGALTEAAKRLKRIPRLQRAREGGLSEYLLELRDAIEKGGVLVLRDRVEDHIDATVRALELADLVESATASTSPAVQAVDSATMDKPTLAIAILFQEPVISPTELARRVGVKRSTLYSSSPRWKQVRQTLMARDSHRLPKGQKSADGNLEAVHPAPDDE